MFIVCDPLFLQPWWGGIVPISEREISQDTDSVSVSGGTEGPGNARSGPTGHRRHLTPPLLAEQAWVSRFGVRRQKLGLRAKEVELSPQAQEPQGQHLPKLHNSRHPNSLDFVAHDG